MGLAGKKKSWVILPFLFIWVVFTTLAVTWGIRYDWPDYVHIDYGFPLVWATHTLSTIAGPVDLWEVNVTILLIDLLLWLGTMSIVVSIMMHFFAGQNS